MSFFTTDAYAETPVTSQEVGANGKPAAMPEQDLFGMVIPFVFIFVVFYFLILRPQQKKFKLHQAMVAGLKKGDEVVTSGGILGKVKSIDDKGFAQVEIASGVVVKVLSATVSSVVNDKAINDNTK